ncbi:hypothetical protein DPV78_007833 [Talaromyces pinophilus]|nr:hypothetical protein DPV78_007833 [Talaromyces pinophilus]
MSRQLISSEKFPPKPHNCKFYIQRTPTSALKLIMNRPRSQSPRPRFLRRPNSHRRNQTSNRKTSHPPKSHLPYIIGSHAHASQQRKVLENLKEVLELSGSSLDKVVKYNVYLADMKDFAAMNEVYIDFLPQPMPSRSCLQAVPPGDGTVIEIECIAQA